MSAATLNCPMCGASASSAATHCAHCGARLATVACPSCFGMLFVGARFCSHCGTELARLDGAPAALPCPRCACPLHHVVIGKAELAECPKCLGLWATSAAVERICADREQELIPLGRAAPATREQGVRLEARIRYLPCPVCVRLMNRVNFARCSTVVVDVCKQHGTWFDRDELRRIVEFVRGGGLDLARARERTELEERRRQLHRERACDGPTWPEPLGTAEWEQGLSAVARAVQRLLRH